MIAFGKRLENLKFIYNGCITLSKHTTCQCLLVVYVFHMYHGGGCSVIDDGVFWIVGFCSNCIYMPPYRLMNMAI